MRSGSRWSAPPRSTRSTRFDGPIGGCRPSCLMASQTPLGSRPRTSASGRAGCQRLRFAAVRRTAPADLDHGRESALAARQIQPHPQSAGGVPERCRQEVVMVIDGRHGAADRTTVGLPRHWCTPSALFGLPCLGGLGRDETGAARHRLTQSAAAPSSRAPWRRVRETHPGKLGPIGAPCSAGRRLRSTTEGC
jgi:hypothetical protein